MFPVAVAHIFDTDCFKYFTHRDFHHRQRFPQRLIAEMAKPGSRQPAFLVPLLATMIGVLSMMLMVVVHRKANCQDPLVTNISDLRGLLTTLQTWEAQHADHPAQAGLRRVATELETVLVAQSTSPPPPVAVPAAASSTAEAERASLRSLAVGGTQCFVAQNAEFWVGVRGCVRACTGTHVVG